MNSNTSRQLLQKTSALDGFDAVGLGSLLALLFTIGIHDARKGPLWSDEIMGFLVVHQPSFAGVMRLWQGGIDSSGFWYEVLGRPWMSAFGTTPLALRMFSAVAVALAAVILWIAARRFYAVLPVATAVSYVFLETLTVRWQLANARTYGLFLLASAIVVLLIFTASDEKRAKPTVLFCVLTFLGYTFLAGSHLLGLLYALIFLLVQLSIDLSARRLRPRLYLSAFGAQLMLFINLPNLRATSAIGKPSFWTIKPTYKNLISLRYLFDKRTAALAAVLLLLIILLRRYQLDRRRDPVYFLVMGFAVLALLLFSYSRIATPVYVDRYLLPFAIAATLVLCELMTLLMKERSRFGQALPYAILAGVAASFYVPRLQRPWLPFPDAMPGLIARLPPNVPVVVANAGTFTELEFNHPAPGGRQLLFPVDWGVALDPATTGGVSGFHEMDNFETYHLYNQDIKPTASILSGYREFAVISDAPDVWLRRRILANPAEVATPYSTFGESATIWLVHAR